MNDNEFVKRDEINSQFEKPRERNVKNSARIGDKRQKNQLIFTQHNEPV